MANRARSHRFWMVSRVGSSIVPSCRSNTVKAPLGSPEPEVNGNAAQSVIPESRICSAGRWKCVFSQWRSASVVTSGAAGLGRRVAGSRLGNPASASTWNCEPESTKMATALDGHNSQRIGHHLQGGGYGVVADNRRENLVGVARLAGTPPATKWRRDRRHVHGGVIGTGRTTPIHSSLDYRMLLGRLSSFLFGRNLLRRVGLLRRLRLLLHLCWRLHRRLLSRSAVLYGRFRLTGFHELVFAGTGFDGTCLAATALAGTVFTGVAFFAAGGWGWLGA